MLYRIVLLLPLVFAIPELANAKTSGVRIPRIFEVKWRAEMP